MAVASWTNSRVVGRFGLRRVGHSATVAFTLIALIHVGVALAGYETLAMFILLQSLTMCAFAFTSSNLSTLAMEHMGPIAGTASSVQGMIGTIGGAILGYVIGREFDGTVIPYLVGTAACAAGGLVALLLTEPKRLFAGIEADPQERIAALESTAIPEDLA
jgi:DHA1 family bicyclomycin/chloramphenicol resistance-like MFS transporter